MTPNPEVPLSFHSCLLQSLSTQKYTKIANAPSTTVALTVVSTTTSGLMLHKFMDCCSVAISATFEDSLLLCIHVQDWFAFLVIIL